jgi:hypothetical protein
MPTGLRGFAKAKDGNLDLIGTMPVPHKPSPKERGSWAIFVFRH